MNDATPAAPAFADGPAVPAGSTASAASAASPAVSAVSAASASARSLHGGSDDRVPLQWLRWLGVAVVALALLVLLSIVLVWSTQRRVQDLERELVRRQQASEAQVTEARLLAKDAQASTRDAAAKVALLDARVAEVAQQRGQLDDLIESLSRSRDDNLAADVEATLRTAMQQSAITANAEPTLVALKLVEERLARNTQPRLEGVRRAVSRDLERLGTVAYADVPALCARLDDAARLADDAPLLAVSAPLRMGGGATPASTAPPAAARGRWGGWADDAGSAAARVWVEVKSLVRVTRIDRPESVLLAPDQGWFLRENLKLRLLDARLALQSRRHDTALADLQAATLALDRYFDTSAKRTQAVRRLVASVIDGARQTDLPRPDDTLAALAVLAPR